MKLVIAEKPSVAKSIAKVIGATKMQDGYMEGGGYLVSWCFGHLVGLAEPAAYDEKYSKWRKEDLPIFPDNYIYQVMEDTKDQFETLKSLMERLDVGSLVEATDAGREGELIFRLVYEKCGCKKPFERLWISSMEDQAILDGFNNLKPGTDYDKLYEAALCRERADWLVGINATRLLSTTYGQTLNVGRVMTPTLALVVDREREIANFKPESFYNLKLELPGGMLVSDRFADKNDAESFLQECKDAGEVTITKVEKKDRQEKAPLLFDLTSLQREANKRYGFTAQQTLDYTQSLYEKKLVSYPRTDARFLTDDMENSISGLLGKISQVAGFQTTEDIDIHKVINNKKVSDHHAIIPTMSINKSDIEELPAGEGQIFTLIASRMIEAVSSPVKYEETTVKAEVCGKVFKAKGKHVIDAGWKSVLGINTNVTSDDGDNDSSNLADIEADSVITAVFTKGESLPIRDITCKEGKTKPKAHFTESSLLGSMERAGADETDPDAERKGLGTSATRAGVIEKLVRIGFIKRSGDKKTKYLIPMAKGAELIDVVPESIKSSSMTAEWENKLLQIEKGGFESGEFIAEIMDMITDLCETYVPVDGKENLTNNTSDIIGKCPNCGADVKVGKYGAYCTAKCGMRFGRAFGKELSDEQVERLLMGDKILLKGLKSKAGKDYSAYLTPAGIETFSYEKNGETISGFQYKFEMTFPKKKSKKGGSL